MKFHSKKCNVLSVSNNATEGSVWSKVLPLQTFDYTLSVVFHARIAADDGRFDLADVARGIHDKLRGRHPHVFPEPGGSPAVAADADAVISNWDRIKSEEKGRSSSLDGIPPALPALAMAQKMIRRARGTGVVPDVGPVEPAMSRDGVDNDLGDVLMALVSWAADNGVDAEDALRGAVGRYSGLVRAVEGLAAAEGIDLAVADEATRARYRQQADGSVGSRETGSP